MEMELISKKERGISVHIPRLPLVVLFVFLDAGGSFVIELRTPRANAIALSADNLHCYIPLIYSSLCSTRMILEIR